jgi:16S rRNA (guanine527-N7)-methyltransferase
MSISLDALEGELKVAFTQAQMDFSADQIGLFARYIELLARWNQIYNLTAVRSPKEMVTRHLVDSLSVLPYLKGPRLLDVGTGAGLPGIPIAIALPDWHVTLLDFNLKKIRFLRQATFDLGLQNIEVAASRIETFQPQIAYDTVISRAYASVQEMVATSLHTCREGGQLLLMKGRYPEQELHLESQDCRLLWVKRLDVPGCEAMRHLVAVEKHKQ